MGRLCTVRALGEVTKYFISLPFLALRVLRGSGHPMKKEHSMKRIAAAVLAAVLFGSPVVLAQSTTKGSSGNTPKENPKELAPGQQMKDLAKHPEKGPGASLNAPGTPTPPAHGAGAKSK